MEIVKTIAFYIELPKGMERSWRNVKRVLKGTECEKHLDLRRASKTNTPLFISVDCCGDELAVKRVKDFPLEDLPCKCGEVLLVGWGEQQESP